MALRIGFFRFGLTDPTVKAWFGGMYESFFRAIETAGATISYSASLPDQKADVLVVPVGGGQDRTSAQAMADFGGPVVLNVGAAAYWCREGFLRRWRGQILFAYGTDRSNYSIRRFAELGLPYLYLPFASDPEVMRPLGLPRVYDVIFVGNAASGLGRRRYAEALLKLAGSRKIQFIGPGWERYSFPRQSIAWGDLLNTLYNLTRICVNISNDEQNRGMDLQLDANNRLFDLAMAGCFQVSNAPEVVRGYFREDEVVAVDSPDKWAAAVLHYLEHPNETEPFREAARRNALAEHTWGHRAQRFLEAVERHLADWRAQTHAASLVKRIARLRDTSLPPYGFREAAAKVRRRLGKVLAK